ncbi:hypothetical protein V6N13_081015 [Hibiscus sabdariffa]
MRPGRMWNDESQSAERLGAWTDADRGGGPSPGLRYARGDVVASIVERSTRRLGVLRHQHAPGIGLRAPHPARLETRTKESDMCPSQRVRKPVRRKEADWRDPSRVGRRGCFVEPFHGIESSKWAIFGKQNWRCGMNRKPHYGAQLRANLEPTKGVGRLRQQDGGHGSRNPLRRGRGGRRKTRGVSPGGAAVGADLGGSSKYSNENFEGRRGERFHVNGTCTWGVRRRRRGPREELSFLFNVLPTLEAAQPEVGSSSQKSTARRVVSGALPAALENPEDRVPSTHGRTHNRIRSPSALNVKVKKFNQVRVNGGSNYDSLKVAKCLVI